MRSPSIKRLMDELELEEAAAKLIKQLCAAADDSQLLQDLIEAEPVKLKQVNSLMPYVRPTRSWQWRRIMILEACDELLGTHGIEPLWLGAGEYASRPPDYQYCNAGDTYSTTLIYSQHNGADNLYIGCWGDIVQKLRYSRRMA